MNEAVRPLRLTFTKSVGNELRGCADHSVVKLVVAGHRPAMSRPPAFTEEVQRLLKRADISPISINLCDKAPVGQEAAEIELTKQQIQTLMNWPRADRKQARSLRIKPA